MRPARALTPARVLLLTLVLSGAMIVGLSCVAEGNCPRAARREEPHVALLGVIAESIDSDELIWGSNRDHGSRALVATSKRRPEAHVDHASRCSP